MPDDIGRSPAPARSSAPARSPARDGSPVAGIVLAAGRSTRMGRNKLLLSVHGEPLVRRTVRRALEAGLSPVLVVLGFEAGQVREALAGLRCEEVLNPEYERGINGSVRRGIARVAADRAGALVILGDMPFVTAAAMARIVKRFRETGAPLVLSTYGGVQAPPTFYARSLFSGLSVGEGEGIGKRMAERHREEAVRVDFPAEMLADIDEPADYDAVASRLAGARAGEGN